MTSPDPLVQFRLQKVEEAILSLTETTEKLVRLEEKHVETRAAIERAFTAIDKQGGRITAIEVQMPKMLWATGLVLAGVVGAATAATAYVWRATLPKALPVPPAAVVSPASNVQASASNVR